MLNHTPNHLPLNFTNIVHACSLRMTIFYLTVNQTQQFINVHLHRGVKPVFTYFLHDSEENIFTLSVQAMTGILNAIRRVRAIRIQLI